MSTIDQRIVSRGCEFCGKEFTEFVYDCKTIHGPWANLCTQCWLNLGTGLGVGLGQKYSIKTLQKVGGRYEI